MQIKNKKILIITLATAFFLIVFALLIFVKKPQSEELSQGDWSINNQSSLVNNAFGEYIKQDLDESEEERKERLGEYFTSDSPALDYGVQEIKEIGADSSNGEVIATRDCHEQEGDNLCLIINTQIKYYKDGEEIKVETVPYWVIIDHSLDEGFRVYDLGVWDFGYDEDLT